MTRLLIAIFLLPFTSLTWATADLNAAADDVCKCLEAPYAQAQQAMEMIQAAQASGDMSALVAAQGEMMGVIGASAQCFEALPAKYPEIDEDPALQDQVMAIAETKCPNPAASMMAQ